MKALRTSESVSGSHVDRCANHLMELYDGRRVSIAELKTKAAPKTEESTLNEAIRCLERNNRVYVERRPRLEGQILRPDLRPTDFVYFGCFPVITRRSLLYRTGVEYGDYTINHVLGCAHMCRYPCYAFQMSRRFGRVKTDEEWMRPRVVANAMELLERELPRLKQRIQSVHLSFMTDPLCTMQ